MVGRRWLCAVGVNSKFVLYVLLVPLLFSLSSDIYMIPCCLGLLPLHALPVLQFYYFGLFLILPHYNLHITYSRTHHTHCTPHAARRVATFAFATLRFAFLCFVPPLQILPHLPQRLCGCILRVLIALWRCVLYTRETDLRQTEGRRRTF